jgi:diacylglycerol kinase family enzyme
MLYSKAHIRWKRGRYFHDIGGVSLKADDAMPVQVDGDHIGDMTEVRIDEVPDAVSLLA